MRKPKQITGIVMAMCTCILQVRINKKYQYTYKKKLISQKLMAEIQAMYIYEEYVRTSRITEVILD